MRVNFIGKTQRGRNIRRTMTTIAVAIGAIFATATDSPRELIVQKYLQALDDKAVSQLFPVSVAGVKVDSFKGSSADVVEDVARMVLEKLAKCKSPCPLKIGAEDFMVKTPVLGQGERGVVYALAGKFDGYVLKISKPDIKSLAILNEEEISHAFWERHQTSNFTVAKKILNSETGLFSVMEEIRGETLTSALFRLGLLQMDPMSNTVLVVEDLSSKDSIDGLKKIWSAVADMIAVVNRNPMMRTSLSPNNIFVSWKGESLEIDKITLIDLGVDPTSDARYFQSQSSDAYLKLSAEKISGYLGKPGFVRPDLFRVQEDSRKHLGIAARYDETSRPQLETLAAKLTTKAVADLTYAELLALPIPTGAIPLVSVDNVLVMRPKTIGELHLFANALNKALSGKSGTVKLFLGDQLLTVQLPALGVGDRGVVFAVQDRNEVIKIPKGNLISILTLMNEARGYEFWRAESLAKNSEFKVMARHTLHPLGLYSTMERDRGEPLTKAMLRMGLITFDPETKQATSHTERVLALASSDRLKLERALMQMKDIMKRHPEMSLSISPNNIHVNYTDATKTKIASVVLIDVGLSSEASKKFDSIVDLASYVEFSRNRVEKYLRVGYADADYISLNRHTKPKPQLARAKLCGGSSFKVAN